jgi:hypothetical protein
MRRRRDHRKSRFPLSLLNANLSLQGRSAAELYDAILFTLGTTNSKFICISTPWSTDSIFWHIFNDPAYSDFAKSHVPCEQALELNGPLKREILEKIKR